LTAAASNTALRLETSHADDDLRRWLAGPVFRDYVYGYPHKTAYRALVPKRGLSEVWAGEARDKPLQLYVHVPFCEMRCGFCNLFTVTDANRDQVRPFLTALRRQAEVTAGALGERRYTSFAIGGGTPTFLTAAELEQVFAAMAHVAGSALTGAPLSVEVSPLTATADRLDVLKAWRVMRISIGVQSFVAAEQKAFGRARDAKVVDAALQGIRDRGFAKLNIDLIYGGPQQTLESWLRSLDQALAWEPEELFLYPLYVRPLTGLDRRTDPQDTFRLACYRAAQERLALSGYAQVSLRQFVKRGVAAAEAAATDEGMVGLGPGARSYTQRLHYSTEYAVGRAGVLAILKDYADHDADGFARVGHGIALDAGEQRRRRLLLALMTAAGLDRQAYAREFGGDAVADVPEVCALERAGLVSIDADRVALSETGLELSDSIGSWLYSAAVRRRMESYAWR
jgi:coproporphyrinogen III oxidase-like Fe-S oxidoreductase